MSYTNFCLAWAAGFAIVVVLVIIVVSVAVGHLFW